MAFTQCRLTQAKNDQRNTAAGFPSAARQREYHASEWQYSQRSPCLITEDSMLEPRHAFWRASNGAPDATS
jgi:hypothetical protein